MDYLLSFVVIHYEAPVAQSVERLTTNPTTPAGLWFDTQSAQIFFRASCPPSSDG